MDIRVQEAERRSETLQETLIKALVGYQMPEIMAALTAVTGGIIGMHAMSRKDLGRQTRIAVAGVEAQAQNAFDEMRKRRHV